MVVTVKYVLFLMRADNKGEGGVLSLMALAQRASAGARAKVLVLLGVIGAALFYGDAVITPAISVLSAVEGLRDQPGHAGATAWCRSRSVILIGLFSVQSRGTAAVGRLFGPIMLVWFLAMGLLGHALIDDPARALRAQPALRGRLPAAARLLGFWCWARCSWP